MKKTKNLTLISLMTAMICVIAPFAITIPISPVPVSLANLIIGIAIYVLGMKKCVASTLLYLLIGFVGMPVFSGFMGGAGKLIGPTGGYLIGYVLFVVIGGVFVRRYKEKKILQLIGMLLGMCSCYLLGTIWLMYQSKMDFMTAFMTGVVPFILADTLKMIMVVVFGNQLRKRLWVAGLVE